MSRQRAPSGGALLGAALALLGGLGCARNAPPPRVARASATGVVEGPYVSPFQYEHYLRGEIALAEGQPALAAREFAEARTGSADDAFLRARHAEALAAAGEWERAGRVLDDSLARFPRSLELHFARARWAEGQGRDELALETLRAAEALYPASARAPLARADLLTRLGRDDEAGDALDAFLARGVEADALAARLELALRRSDLDAAVALVRADQGVPQRDASTLQRVAELALVRGRPELALVLLSELPAALIERRLLVRAHALAGRHDEAEALLALARDDEVGGDEERAALYLLVRRADVALELLGAAMARPSTVTPRQALLIGECLLALERPADAATWLSRVPLGAPEGALARAHLTHALRAAGLPALADEVTARVPLAPER